MVIGVPKEIFPGERRVSLVPEVIPKLAPAGVEVVVETHAGAEAGFPDAEYAAKGAKIIAERILGARCSVAISEERASPTGRMLAFAK